MPHPSESKVNLRIQTYSNSNVTAADALKDGLDSLENVSRHILTLFDREVEKFQRNESMQADSE